MLSTSGLQHTASWYFRASLTPTHVYRTPWTRSDLMTRHIGTLKGRRLQITFRTVGISLTMACYEQISWLQLPVVLRFTLSCNFVVKCVP